MRTRIFAIAALLTAGQLQAAPDLSLYSHQGRQSGQSSVTAGLIVNGSTVWHTITVAGGWTLRCGFSSLEINEQRADSSFSLLGGASLSVSVPSVVPSTYTMPGWSTVPVGTCADCTHQYRGSALDGSGSITAGVGVRFTLTPGAEAEIARTSTFGFCRRGQPVCCTDGCFIP